MQRAMRRVVAAAVVVVVVVVVVWSRFLLSIVHACLILGEGGPVPTGRADAAPDRWLPAPEPAALVRAKLVERLDLFAA